MVKHTLKGTMITLLLMIVLTGSTACTRPPEFEVGSLHISSLEVVSGESITIAVDIKNVGGKEGTYTAILKINAVEVDTKDVMVAAGDTETISFEVTEDVPGMYTIDLEGLTDAFKVLKPAEFKVSNLRITPEEVKAGGEVTLKVDIENIGDVEGTYTVTLKVDGVKVETEDMVVSAGDTETISFELTEDVPAMYTIDLEGLTGEVHFRELKPAEFKVGGLTITPNPVKVGEATKITLSIRNVGEAQDTYTATMVMDGLVEQTRDVTLAGGATKSVSFSVSKDSPGSYAVEIGDLEAVLEVFEPVRLDTGTYIVRETRSGKPRIEITENNLKKDAVVVLCSSEEPSVPLLAVYIQSGDAPTIRRIKKGTYVVYITTGRDWNNDSKKFTADATYGRFAYTPGPGQISTEYEFEETSRAYTVWQFTLNPVPGGIWATEFLSEAGFPELK